MKGFGRSGAVDWLIVGLGNPGREHESTRHNVGFMVLDALSERWGLAKRKERFKGLITEGRVSVEPARDAIPLHSATSLRVALLWPLTYMNDVGRSIGPASGSLKLGPEKVLVIHDEIDLPFGEVRARLGGGLAGHNGLKSTKQALGSPEFWRVRVGVGRPSSTDPEIVSSYVLGRFKERASEVEGLIDDASNSAEAVLNAEVAS